jgi:hypothetical protein
LMIDKFLANIFHFCWYFAWFCKFHAWKKGRKNRLKEGSRR